MENVLLTDLIKAINGEFLIGNPKNTVVRISINTRTMHRGDYYWAIKGERFDGHVFLKEAIEKKAKGVIISRDDPDFGKPFPIFPDVIRVQDTRKALGEFASFYRSRWNIPVVGITGSNGKTTTKQMLLSILKQRGDVLHSVGNFNNLIGLPLTLLNISSKHQYVVVEMGTSGVGEIARLSSIAKPTVGVISNVGFSHLEGLKNPEGVFKEKRAIIDSLPKDGHAILNADDDYCVKLIKEGIRKTVTFGLTRGSDVRAESIEITPLQTKFVLHCPGVTVPVSLPIMGRFNVYNALAAAAAAYAVGVNSEQIKAGLEQTVIPKMRMETTTQNSGAVLVNDAYNANPTSIRMAIKSFIEAYSGKYRVAVLGDMLELGPDTKQYHSELGEFAGSQSLSKVYYFGALMRNAFEASKSENKVYCGSKEELVKELRAAISGNMAILFKGSRAMGLEEVISELQK